MRRATGSFEVSLQPLSNTEVSSDPLFGRLLLSKKFNGDLVASARGQMLSASTPVKGSAGYVAIDHITGELDGRKGTFVRRGATGEVAKVKANRAHSAMRRVVERLMVEGHSREEISDVFARALRATRSKG